MTMLSAWAGAPLALAAAQAMPLMARARGDAAMPARLLSLMDAGDLYDCYGGRIALVPVVGLLVNKLGWFDPWGWWTGYDVLRMQIETALADPEVAAVALIIDSPGGHAAGLPELAQWINGQAAGAKPIVGIGDGLMCSAAYYLGAACTALTMPPSGFVGSIGAICEHWDFSKMLAEWGLAIEVIAAGERKADGHPAFALSDGARASYQTMIDRLRGQFVADVAAFRGLAEADLMGTEAGVYDGFSLGADPEPLRLGLVDAIRPAEDALAALLADISTPTAA